LWILFAFSSALFSGLTAVLAKIGLKGVDSNVATAIRTVVILLLSWLVVLSIGSYTTISDISTRTLLFLILSGIATGASWLFYFKALQLGDVNKVTPIDKSSVILTMILGMSLLGETVSFLKILGMFMIGAGTYMMINKKKTDNTEQPQFKWLIYAFLSAVFASLTAILGKVGIENVESNLGTAIRTIVVLILAWAIVFITNKQSELKNISKKSYLFLILSGVTTSLAWLSFYRALQTGPASVVVPIDKLSVVVAVTFAFFVLGEKLNLKSFAGLILIITGTLLLLI
jgi:bacterial/archaeal transporter family protein